MSIRHNDDNFVTIGTAFDIPEENEILKKATKTGDQIAVDDKGRRRFHGAFTGGFSAGYFNTVGSKEGWSPSTFKSSRSEKKDVSTTFQKFTPEDFMDAEDFTDHGIAPKKLQANETYEASEAEVAKRKLNMQRKVDQSEIHSSIPGGIPIDDLIMPAKLSIGIKLLKKMGWKSGQGVGEKLDITESIPQSTTKKVYGCSVPHDWKSNNENIDMKTFITMLAPKDVQPLTFKSKDNVHGLGYSGLDPAFSMFGGRKNESSAFKPSGKEKRGIKGQAFGVGVFEDEDDDIYGADALSNYDLTMDMADDDKHDNYGWSGAPKTEKYKGCLKGFIKAKKLLSPAPAQMPISLPSGYVPRHTFDKSEKTTAPASDNKTKLSSKERQLLLGEKEKGFNDINKWALKWEVQKGDSLPSSQTETRDTDTQQKDSKTSRFSSRWDKDVRQERPKSTQSTEVDNVGTTASTFPSAGDSFKPFVKYPDKQFRYEQFLKARRDGKTPELQYDRDVTEWERERELEEFKKASILYRPLSSAISNRFTRASIITRDIDEGKTDKQKVNPNEKIETSRDGVQMDCQQAAKVGMYGKLTRTVSEWHPDKILCRRFNIREPYPDSRIRGVPGRTRKSHSFFKDDYFTEKQELKEREDEKDLKSVLEEKETIKKPLAIKIGPLSHLNEDKNDYKKNEETISISKTADPLNLKVGKPSIDLFKEIFDDTSDSESDSEDVKNDMQGKTTNELSNTSPLEVERKIDSSDSKFNAPDESIGNKNIDELQGSKPTSEKTKSDLPLSFLNESHNQQKNFFDPKEKDLRISEKDTSHTNVVKETNYKHEIRPLFNQNVIRRDHDKNRTRESSVPSKLSNKSDSDDWEESAEKSSRKKSRKSKPKKHKKKVHKHSSKKSKKHKHRKERSSTDTENENSDEDGLIPSNTEILMKLKKLSKRPSAADFM